MSQETIKLTSELLNEKNYLSWARSVTFALSGRGKLGHVTDTKPKPVAAKPAEEALAIDEWQMADHSVITWILASIEPKLSKMFLYSKSAKELWEKLESMYGQRNNYSYIYQLKQQIYGAKKENKSHTDHLVELTAKFDELDKYLPPTTNLAEIEKRRHHDKIYIYLGSLDSSYEAVRSQILLSSEFPPFSAVVAMVQREESRRNVMCVEVQEARSVVENQAFAVTVDRGRNKGRDGERCSHCKKVGHTADRCWVLNPHLKPKWKGEGGSHGQGEAAKKGDRTLDTKEGRKGFSVRGEINESKGPEDSRLDRIKEMVSKLIELMRMGNKGLEFFNFKQPSSVNGPSRPNIVNKNQSKPKSDSGYKCLTIGFTTKNYLENCTR
jgi:gag-polypeptide of LTR copia-type